MNDIGGDQGYDVVADLYDYVVPYHSRDDVAFFVEAAKASGGPVLEVGCGTGRVLIPTARSGVDIVGIDASSHMLDQCRKHLRNEPQAVQARTRLVEADMRGFDLAERFALVTLPFRPFQHLVTVNDQLACLDVLRRHLVDGGDLILDVFNPNLEALVQDDLGKESGDEPEFLIPDGRRVLRRHRTVSRDLFNQTCQIELIYYVTHPDGCEEKLTHGFAMRYMHRFEAEHLLERAGFAVQHVYGDYDKSPYGSKYPGELIFVARKARAD